MDLQKYKEKKFEKIISPMVDHMNHESEDGKELCDCGYTQNDIDCCVNILDDYIDELITLVDRASESAILDSVKKVVLSLNELNENANYSLIEADQKECICQFIQDAATDAGLPQTSTDITKDWWRMW